MSNNDSDNLENYKFIKTIGVGTFGKVKLSIHLPTKEYVAIKILEKSKVIAQMGLERIEREIEFLKILNHPNIIQIYEVIDAPKNFYIVMEYASGGELFHYIVRKKRLDEKEASFFFTQLIFGIRKIQKKKICHRDIKPENLLLTEKRIIKIIDFGLSKQYKDTLSSQSGSPCYAAPEMIKGNEYSGLMIDIWACGINLYAMICGYLPFDDKDNNVVFDKILQGNVVFPDETIVHVSNEAKDLILKILTPDPSKRIKIDEILNHPFMKSGIQEYNEAMRPNYNYQDNIIIDYMVNKLKYSNKNRYISNLMKTNKFNNITTTYKLIKKKIIEGRFDFNYKDKEKNNNMLIKKNLQNIRVNLRRNKNLNDISNNNKRSRTSIKDINSKSEDKNIRATSTRRNRYKIISRIKPLNNNILFNSDCLDKDNHLHYETFSNNIYQNTINNPRYNNTCISEGKRRVNGARTLTMKTPQKNREIPFYDNNKKILPNNQKFKTTCPLSSTTSNGLKRIQFRIDQIINTGEISPREKNKSTKRIGINNDGEYKNNFIKSNENSSKNKSIIRVRKRNIVKKDNNNNIKRPVDITSDQSTNITNLTLTSFNNASNNITYKTIDVKSKIPKKKENTEINNLLYNRLKRSMIGRRHNRIKSNTINRIVIPDNLYEMNLKTENENNNHRLYTINTNRINDEKKTNIIYNNYLNHRRNNCTFIKSNNEDKFLRTTFDERIVKIKNKINEKCTPISLKFKNTLAYKDDNPRYVNTEFNENKNRSKPKVSIRNKYKYKYKQNSEIKNFLIVNNNNSKIQQIKTKLISFCNKNHYRYNNYKGSKYTVFIDNTNSFIFEINSENNGKFKLYHNTGSESITKKNMDKLLLEINII